MLSSGLIGFNFIKEPEALLTTLLKLLALVLFKLLNFIKIEHSDGSLASYKGLDNNIEVKIGQLVYPQTKLGKLAKYDTKERYKLYLSLYSFKTIKGKTLNNIESSDIEINYITPKFYINGDIKELKNREIFEVDYNEDVLFKEMRRREIKRYKSSNN